MLERVVTHDTHPDGRYRWEGQGTGYRLTLWQVPEVCSLLRHLNINNNLFMLNKGNQRRLWARPGLAGSSPPCSDVCPCSAPTEHDWVSTDLEGCHRAMEVLATPNSMGKPVGKEETLHRGVLAKPEWEECLPDSQCLERESSLTPENFGFVFLAPIFRDAC